MKKMLLAAALASAFATGALAQDKPVSFAFIGELSGAGAVSSTNFRDGALMAIEEINAKGGILGRKIELKQYDTQTNPGTARSQMQKAIDEEPYVILGPIFSGIVKVSMMLAQQAEIPQIMGGEASDLTQQGNAYLFRTSFGQQVSMPKIANYIRDNVKAKNVAIVWVNNDFGKRALPARGAQAGRYGAADRRDHAAWPEGDRSGGRSCERRTWTRRDLG